MSRAAEDNRQLRADKEAQARHRMRVHTGGRKLALRLLDKQWHRNHRQEKTK